MAPPRLRPQQEAVCECCQVVFTRRYINKKNQPRFCSRACSWAGIRGAAHGRWEGGMSPDRFWGTVHKATPDECWPWRGIIDSKGYGVFTAEQRKYGAHRIAYTLAKGPIPEGLLVRHTCDNPPCCNPAHLLVGTQKDNIADCIARGRFKGGSKPAKKREDA